MNLNELISFEIILLVLNQLLISKDRQPYIKQISVGNQGDKRWAKLRNSRAWKMYFNTLIWCWRSSFFFWSNGHRPNNLPTYPTSLPTNWEAVAAKEYTRENTSNNTYYLHTWSFDSLFIQLSCIVHSYNYVGL